VHRKVFLVLGTVVPRIVPSFTSYFAAPPRWTQPFSVLPSNSETQGVSAARARGAAKTVRAKSNQVLRMAGRVPGFPFSR
jgi:hypothetical protein